MRVFQLAGALRTLIFLALVATVACTDKPSAFKTNDIGAVTWGGDFSLINHDGARMWVSDYAGKVVILFFGYTHCPDICSPTLTKLAAMRRALSPAERERVQVLFVTVDPAHDTPAQLKGFIPKFDPSFVGLTGSAAEVAAVARDYKVGVHQVSGSKVDHSASVFIKDATGKLRAYANETAPADAIAHDVRLLIKESRRAASRR